MEFQVLTLNELFAASVELYHDRIALKLSTPQKRRNYYETSYGELGELAGRLFTEGRLAFRGLRTLGTPRRLVLHVEELAEAQEPLITKVIGPAERVAFEEGKPTRAAEGFARAQGVSLEELKIAETERGRYLSIERREEGRETGELLKELLPRLVRELPSPKSMRWGEGELRFVRPIHWVACLFGGEVIEFELEGIRSSGSSRGHRFLSPGTFSFKNFRDYLQGARERFVLVEPEERRGRIAELIEEKARELGGEALKEVELLETVGNLVEWPVAISGSFDPKFLSLPKEVLISALRDHQRCFSLIGPGGELLPHFISISNTTPQDEAVVRAGNERV
ncbi:MAG: glycine--tRNA ligase subunit beta, partial [Candidatus Bipolaricaulia bacterium]